MRVIIEIDNEAELLKLDPLLRALGARDVRIAHIGHVQKAKDALATLFAYAKQHPLVVKSLDIPSREERNAR